MHDRPRPELFTLDESDGRMVIEWRWFKASHLVMIPLAIQAVLERRLHLKHRPVLGETR